MTYVSIGILSQTGSAFIIFFFIWPCSAGGLENICHFSTLTGHFLVCLDLCHKLNEI